MGSEMCIRDSLYTVPDEEAGVAVATLKNEEDDVISSDVTFVAAPVVAELAPMNRAQRKHFRSRQRELKKVDDSRKVRVLRDSLGSKTRRRSASDTLGSLIMATLVCVVAGLAFLITQRFVSGTASLYLPTCLWAIATSAFAASGLLIVGNSWKKSSEEGEGGVRRLFQVLVGMATGAVSWSMLQYMQFMPEYTLEMNGGPMDGAFRVNNPNALYDACLLYTSPSPRDATLSRMPSSA